MKTILSLLVVAVLATFSEKLLHLTVWWGRIAASDVIIDVEKHDVIYHELGNYGQLVS